MNNDTSSSRASLNVWLRSPQAVKFPAVAKAVDHYLTSHSDCAECVIGLVEAVSELNKS